ncbi:MAG: hypothetical protein P4L49_07080 [Desulfosporosinus sp.]|nr:hypothetical protein [Desulfosporosinus sp.]
MWEVYKEEMKESEIIKHLREQDIIEDQLSGSPKNNDKVNPIDIGYASERGTGELIGDIYLTTAVLKRKQEEDKIREEKIAEIQKILNINREEALKVINLTENKDSDIKRPDKYFASKRKDIDVTIKEIIVPELISRFSINQHSDNLKNCPLFQGRFSWIKNRVKDNGGMLAVYFANYLNSEVGAKRPNWSIDDYEMAHEKLPEILEYAQKVIEDYLGTP